MKLGSIILCAALLPVTSMAGERFHQGPGKINEELEVHGTVIGPAPGLKAGCYLMLARKSETSLPGGSGRFFLCNSDTDMKQGQSWSGRAIQTDRQMAKVGPSWRPLPVFTANCR